MVEEKVMDPGHLWLLMRSIITNLQPSLSWIVLTRPIGTYKMPLLDIIGVSSFNTTFYSCFAFLRKEEKEDHVWALNMFRDILGVNCHPSVIVTDRELALMNAIPNVFPLSKKSPLCVAY